MDSSRELVQDMLSRFELKVITLGPKAYIEVFEELASRAQEIADAVREEMS